MDITLGVIFVITFVTIRLQSSVSVYSLSIKTSTFQMLQQHPLLRKCIESVLHENKYFGCRVFELTGQCQGLLRSWGLNQTIEQGYAYAKRVDLQESFQQSALTLSRDDSIWQIPVVLDTGARIDISMSIPKLVGFIGEVFTIGLLRSDRNPDVNEKWDEWYWHKIHMWIYKTYIQIGEFVRGDTGRGEELGNTLIGEMPSHLLSRERFKISLLAQSDSLAVFAEDEEVVVYSLTAGTRIMRHLYLSRHRMEVDPVVIHDIKYTGI